MTQLHYREIVCEGCYEAEVIDQQQYFDLLHFAQICGHSPEWVLALIEHDIVHVRQPAGTPQKDHQHYQVLAIDIARARRAYRLQRDFDASLPAVALMLEMIDELQGLRQQMRYSQNK
ncbi:chaperone modulatory protein CbpM [Acinetobacter calcoaceticus]|uniref:Chaperone modulatory protein CbpM n=1 Tax=Acinetobacter calcoaceticus TaxID=471 RepID=A0A4R1YA61_ACICA|nr:chaperone modulatory protein CbpM [Acinetobacter calcoaceticus]